jgi:DNA-binding NarL/FixJ family response regulator
MATPKPLSVLVVDDNSDVRFLVRTLLSEHDDVEVVGEADGAQSALEQIDGLDPDVVILDARMPRIDGFEAAPMILERRPHQTIMLLTTIVDDDIRRRAAAAGIRACLSKEQFDDIAAAVKAVMPAGPEAPGRPVPS